MVKSKVINNLSLALTSAARNLARSAAIPTILNCFFALCDFFSSLAYGAIDLFIVILGLINQLPLSRVVLCHLSLSGPFLIYIAITVAIGAIALGFDDAFYRSPAATFAASDPALPMTGMAGGDIVAVLYCKRILLVGECGRGIGHRPTVYVVFPYFGRGGDASPSQALHLL